ncbi:Dihydroorotate dehydrogenase, catalytic subunit [Devosia sp. DBB001]|nr:Dihydroorotate dehydrogenase, catalytic subunit [Devosia sp. DBB001]
MTRLSSTFAGLTFKNPLMVGSCSLTADADSIETLVRAGAGSIVTKTISPEIRAGQSGFKAGRYATGWTCKADPRVSLPQAEALLKRLRQSTDVPLIVNVIGRSDNAQVWGETCQRLEAAGAHAIELDLNCHPDDGLVLDVPKNLSLFDDFSIGQEPAASARVTKAVKAAVSIPVIAKMTLRAPDIVGVAVACEAAGADAISGVNMLGAIGGLDVENGGAGCFAGFDDLETGPLLGPELSGLGRKYTALIGKATRTPYISGSGVMTWQHVIERILLGAYSVQVVSALYFDGPDVIGRWLNQIEQYLDRHNHADINQIRGTALARFRERNSAAYVPQVPSITDPARWAEVSGEVYEKSAIACKCISREGAQVSFEAHKCVGCALPAFHAPDAVAMVPAR